MLQAEQGLGDALEFMRYVPLVQAAGASVVLYLPARLRRLAAQLFGLAALVMTGDTLPAFDLFCPLMSPPQAFGTTVETIPSQVPYLSPRQKLCKQRLHSIGQRQNCG